LILRKTPRPGEAYLISPIGIVSGCGKVEESTNGVGSITGHRVESADIVKVGKGMSREFPGLLISFCVKSMGDDDLLERHRWQNDHWKWSLVAIDIEEMINSPSSHGPRSNTQLNPLGIPIVEELVIPASIKDNLSSRKSRECSAQYCPGL
jgi:hypothetical protein